jgi:hypothetical protein
MDRRYSRLQNQGVLMLNRFYFLDQGDCTVCPDGGEMPVAHVIAGQPGQVGRLVERLYSAGGDFPFCLALRGDHLEALAREALLMFFHPAYVVAEKGKPVFVEGRQGELAEVFRAQRLEVEIISLQDVKLLHVEDHDPAGDYYRYCQTSYSSDDVFLLSGGDPAGWMTRLKRVEQELAVSHDRFYRLATESLQAKLAVAAQEREISRLREERSTLLELLELSSKHDEVNYILKFYKNEYEILPLWYKRLGHIIKVIQGKRSFRSLFDKRVKKYKD